MCIRDRWGHQIIRNFLHAARSYHWEIQEEVLEISVDPARVFVTLYGAAEQAFWLDDAAGTSYLGDASGPLARTKTFRVGEGDFFEWLAADLAKNTVAPGAVSYTHLDVYKRQA